LSENEGKYTILSENEGKYTSFVWNMKQNTQYCLKYEAK
jgi:outer membrane biogenesis lipoprotein LolB